MRDRFIVTSVSGYPISASTAPRSHPARRSFAVLDRAYCYAIVEEFITGSSRAVEERNERRAHELAERLNAEDRKRRPDQLADHLEIPLDDAERLLDHYR